MELLDWYSVTAAFILRFLLASVLGRWTWPLIALLLSAVHWRVQLLAQFFRITEYYLGASVAQNLCDFFETFFQVSFVWDRPSPPFSSHPSSNIINPNLTPSLVQGRCKETMQMHFELHSRKSDIQRPNQKEFAQADQSRQVKQEMTPQVRRKRAKRMSREKAKKDEKENSERNGCIPSSPRGKEKEKKDDSLQCFLQDFGLGHVLETLEAMGAKEVSHLTDIEPNDLDQTTLKLLEKRRLLRAIHSLKS